MDGPAGLPVLPPVAQTPQQLPLECTPGQDVEVRRDRLVRDAHGRIVRRLRDQPLGNLLRRPALAQLVLHGSAKPCLEHQLPWTPRTVAGVCRMRVGGGRPIASPSGAQPPLAGTAQLPRDRAGTSPELVGDHAPRPARCQRPADLLALGEGESGVPPHLA